MAKQKRPRGICSFCGKETADSGMTRHLLSCKERREAVMEVNSKKGQDSLLYHLKITSVRLKVEQ